MNLVAFHGPWERAGEWGVRKDEATMIKDGGRSTSKPRTWTRVAALVAVFVLSFLAIRLLAGRSAGGYRPLPFFHLFFSDTIHMKAWLATGAITLALFQVLSAARLFELFHWAPSGRFWGGMHRMSGYLTILLTPHLVRKDGGVDSRSTSPSPPYKGGEILAPIFTAVA